MKYSTVEEIQKKLVLISEVPGRAKTLEDYEISELLNYIDNTLEDSLIYGLPHTLFYQDGKQCFEIDQVYGGSLEEYERAAYRFVKQAILKAKEKGGSDAQSNTPAIEGIKELITPEAKAILNKAVEVGLIFKNDKRYRRNCTLPQLALFIDMASEQLKIKDKWKYFEPLFNENNLAQERSKSINIMGKVVGEDKVYRIFE